ncbi:MAG: ATP-binding protein [Bacteroidales bacterium]|nr:MAG: ATP-binding protein [Bacteroidales bacterium]
MIYKNFRVNAIIRILLIATTIFLLFYTWKEFFITPVLIGAFIVIQLYALFKYIDKTNRDLSSFLESIRFSEFTRSFQMEGMGSSFDELNKAFNDVIKDFQNVRTEKEEHFHYLQSIVQNIDVSIIAYQKDGTVEMINKSAKKLFQLSGLKNVKQLYPISNELVEKLLSITPGESALIKVQQEDDLLQLAINSNEFKIHTKTIVLVTIKNIQSVLEEQETEAWQKLISVLTHEIMNSITPIASLSSTIDMMIKSFQEEQAADPNASIDSETAHEIQQGLQTIHKRSTGLLHFVNTYRNLTRIPKPNFRITTVKNVFNNIIPLMNEEISQVGISFHSEIDPPEIEFSVDIELLEQVIINILKNAIHALEGAEKPQITLKAFLNKRGKVTIQVADNGVGILPEVLDKIFIPFFTTKPKGSGIGLSLSRQIMRLHGGSITAYSVPGHGTTFTLTF